MTPRRVTMVCSSDAWGGTEKWSLRAAELLASRDVEVTFAGRSPELFAQHARSRLRFLKLPFMNEADLVTVLRLAVHFRSQDVVVLTRVRDYWLGGLAAKLSGTPALLRLGVVRRLRENYWMDRLRYGTLPSAVLVNAQPIADTLKQTSWMRSKPVSVISNGVDAPGPLSTKERNDVRDSLAIPKNALLVVGTGRLAEEKRWHLMLDAIAELNRRSLPVCGVLLGEGDQRGALEARAKELSVDQLVSFPGQVTDADRWLSAADLYVQPSRNEGLSNSLLEAMGRGVASVTSAAGGVRDHFTDGEELLIADVDSEADFLSRVVRLAEDSSLRKQIASRGLSAVRKTFAWERMTDQLLDLLATVSEARR